MTAATTLLVVLLAYAAPAVAQQEDGVWRKTIIVSTLDGTTMEYLIDADTKIRIEKPNLVIETEGVEINYELENLARFNYGKKFVSTGIGGVTVNEQPFTWKDEVILFNQLPENTLIEVFTADGKQILSYRCTGEAQLPLANLSDGVYLVKVNQATYKIIKR